MFENVKRALQSLRGEPQPKTYISSNGGSLRNYFSERARNQEQLKKYQTIYEQGGIVSAAIDTYALFVLANGWRLESKDDSLKEDVEDWLDAADLDSIIWSGVVDALVFGDAFQENVSSRGGDFVAIVPRLASSFTINYNEFGTISGYEQKLLMDGIEKTAQLQKEQITHLQLIKLGGSVYGQSLIQRAYDEIMRDAKTAESTAVAIERHGYRKYHVKVGKEGETIPQEVLTDIDKQFQLLETKNDFVTCKDVEIAGLDIGSLGGIGEYNDLTVMRLCAALGVPEEMLGLRRGSSDATASTRAEAFYKKIGTMQSRIARCYNMNVIDRITGKPGAVKLVFNDASPEDEKQKAAWIAQIMSATPIDPFAVLPKAWIQEQFNIEESDIVDSEDMMPPPMPMPPGQEPTSPEATTPAEKPAEKPVKIA